jgi:hypothetical protein
MAEDVKQNEQKGDSKNVMATIFKVILGLVFLALGGYFIFRWRAELLILIKGCVGMFLILAGLITLAIAKE